MTTKSQKQVTLNLVLKLKKEKGHIFSNVSHSGKEIRHCKSSLGIEAMPVIPAIFHKFLTLLEVQCFHREKKKNQKVIDDDDILK